MAGAGRGGKTAPFGNQKAVGSNTQSGVMMKPPPAASFKVSQAEFLFQFLVIAFDNPAVFGEINQFTERGIGWKRRQPVLQRLLFFRRPFDEKPFFRVRLGAPVIAVSGPDSHSGKSGDQLVLRALSPGDMSPCVGGQ